MISKVQLLMIRFLAVQIPGCRIENQAPGHFITTGSGKCRLNPSGKPAKPFKKYAQIKYSSRSEAKDVPFCQPVSFYKNF